MGSNRITTNKKSITTSIRTFISTITINADNE